MDLERRTHGVRRQAGSHPGFLPAAFASLVLLLVVFVRVMLKLVLRFRRANHPASSHSWAGLGVE